MSVELRVGNSMSNGDDVGVLTVLARLSGEVTNEFGNVVVGYLVVSCY